MSLTLTSTHLSYVARSTHLLNISSYSLPSTGSKVVDQSKVHYKSSVEVDGYEWDIRLYPVCSPRYQIELQLVFLGEAGANKLAAALSCRMVDPSRRFEPSEEKISETTSFQHPSDSSQPLAVVGILIEAID
jgi:speckle-type POZ protein